MAFGPGPKWSRSLGADVVVRVHDNTRLRDDCNPPRDIRGCDPLRSTPGPLGVFDVSGRRVVITGGTAGICLAAAGHLAGSGAQVVICGRLCPAWRSTPRPRRP